MGHAGWIVSCFVFSNGFLRAADLLMFAVSPIGGP